MNHRELSPSEVFEAGLESALMRVDRVMRERHKKYGPGNIAEFGELGILVRLSDKLARLKNNRDTDFGDESVGDTILDVVGYGLIWMMWRNGSWPGSKNSRTV